MPTTSSWDITYMSFWEHKDKGSGPGSLLNVRGHSKGVKCTGEFQMLKVANIGETTISP